MFENPINKLRFWCHKVIPLVYDEALSYYEVVCKVAKKINEVITDVNGLHDTVVFSINGKTPTDGDVELDASSFSGSVVGSINGIVPDDEGAVTLNAEDVGALPDSIDPVESVNGISPDGNGNVNVGTVKSVNNALPDANGNVNLPTVAGVTSVDGIGPDGSGDVILGAIRSINGETPNAQGAVTLSADDVGALPDTVVPIERAILPYGFNTLSDVLAYLIAHKNCVYTYDTWATVPWGPPSNTQNGTWLFEGFCFDGQLTGYNNARPVLCASFNDNYGNIAKYSVSIIYDETQNIWTGAWHETYNSKIYTTTVEANVTPAADVSVYGIINNANNYVSFGVHGTTTVAKGGDDVLFTVPEAYRPPYETYAVATIIEGVGFAVRIKTNGDVALMWQGNIPANALFYIAYAFQKIV